MVAARMVPPLSPDEAPDVSDASVANAIVMLATLERETEQARFHGQMAEAVEDRDWRRIARLHRRMSAIEPTVARIPRIARAAAARYDAGQAPPLPDPTLDARARRALLRIAAFTENRLPQYWRPPETIVPPRKTKPCRRDMLARLAITDSELHDIGAAPMEPDATARRLLVEARNRRTAECRSCGGCSLAKAPVTRALPH